MANTDNIDNIDKGLGWLEKLLELARKYRIVDWIEIFLVIFVMGSMITVFAHPQETIRYFQDAAEKQHKELIEKRLENNIEVQKITDKLLYSFQGSMRVVLCEGHNSQVSYPGGIPFAKISATYESLQDGIYPVSTQYKDINLSLIPFASHLSDCHYYFGDSMSVKTIDKSFAYRLKANQVEHFAAVSIVGRKGTIGFLILTFNNIDEVDQKQLKYYMENASVQLAILLETKDRA